MHQDCASCEKRGIGHEQEGTQDVRDAEDRGRRENGVQGVKSFLLRLSPGPRAVLLGEEDNGCDNVGVVGDELSIEVRKAKEGTYSLDRGWGMPVSDGRKFCRVHVDKALTNNHSQVLHGGSVKGVFQDLEGKTMLLEVRKDLTSSLVM